MKTLTFAAAAAATLAASPALAATTYDISDIGSPFSYAQYNGGTDFTAFTAGCAARPDLGVCFEGPQGAGAAQVVYDGSTVLVAHPGSNEANNTTVLFTAPISSTYNFDVLVRLLDPNGGNGVTLGGYLNGAFTSLGALTPPVGGPTSSVNYTGSTYLTAGTVVGLVIGNNGNNGNDSLGLSGFISAVPEPQTWALLILGIGMVGAAMRRRVRQTTRITFA